MSDVPSTYNRQAVPNVPFRAEDFQKRLLRAAGIDETKQVELLKRVVESAEQALDADKETPITHYGEVKSIHTQPDHSARAKAREQIITIIGLDHKPASEAKPQTPSIPLAPWMKSISVSVNDQPQPVVVEADILQDQAKPANNDITVSNQIQAGIIEPTDNVTTSTQSSAEISSPSQAQPSTLLTTPESA